MIPVLGKLDSKTGAVHFFRAPTGGARCGFCGKRTRTGEQFQIVRNRIRYHVHKKCRTRFEEQE